MTPPRAFSSIWGWQSGCALFKTPLFSFVHPRDPIKFLLCSTICFWRADRPGKSGNVHDRLIILLLRSAGNRIWEELVNLLLFWPWLFLVRPDLLPGKGRWLLLAIRTAGGGLGSYPPACSLDIHHSSLLSYCTYSQPWKDRGGLLARHERARTGCCSCCRSHPTALGKELLGAPFHNASCLPGGRRRCEPLAIKDFWRERKRERGGRFCGRLYRWAPVPLT